MKWVIFACFLLVWLKSVTVGSEFSLILWFRFRKFYSNWYFKLREPETFENYMQNHPYTMKGRK